MVGLLVAAFLVAHGLIHAAIYAVPRAEARPAPFDPSASWALAAADVPADSTRAASVALSWVTAAIYALAALALLLDVSAWVGLAASAAIVGIVLKGLWFNRWLVVGVALDTAVLVATAAGWPASLV